MRILHISTRLILGGSQENTVLSCEGHARRGHDVHLAFGPIYGPEGSMLDRVEGFRADDGRGITTHELPHLVREIRPSVDRRALRELRALIEDLKPDVVHTHSSKAGILGRLAAWPRSGQRSSHTPAVIHTIHGPPFMPIEGSAVRRLKIRAINHAYTQAERFAATRCHAIISVADAMTEQFLARGIGREGQYRTVRSGMDTTQYLEVAAGESREEARKALGFEPGDYVVGTVARLAEHKGHDDVLDALSEDIRQDPNLKLLWVGDGWWTDRLRARASDFGVLEQIVFTGLVPPERIPMMMRAMDVLCHPSWREGLPRTVPQALLTGTPVIATDTDGTREACIPGKTGILVPVHEPGAIRAAVRELRTDPGRAERLAHDGRTMCATMFDAERMIDELDGVYADAIKRLENTDHHEGRDGVASDRGSGGNAAP